MASRAREFSQINLDNYLTSESLNDYALINSPSFTGTVSFPSGSASAPSISASGDTNTGIFFPAADTIAFSEGGTEAMRINSNGHLTIPNKPLFLGYPTTDRSGGGMPEGNMIFTASINNGNHYNASNGRFTAPVTGYYRSTFYTLQLNAAAFRLTKNGATYANTNHAAATMSYITTGSSILIQLNANDYINMYQWNGGGYYSGWSNWTVEQIA